MTRFGKLSTFGLLGAFAATLAGCTGGGIARDNARALDEAVTAAQTALETILPGLPGEVEPLGVRNGVPVVQYDAPDDAPAFYSGAYGYGAWLGERGFAVYSAPSPEAAAAARLAGIPNIGVPYILADPADASHGAPSEESGFSGTWSGVMLGVDTGISDGGAGVQGNASLELHSGMGDANVDVEFSDVVGIRSGNDYDGHSWHGISVTDSDFLGVSGDGGTVSGQFYGDHHEDVMGAFAYDDLTGAWGASRMTAGPGAGGDDMGGDDMGGDDMGGDDMGGDDMGGDDMGGDDMGGDDMGGDDMGGDDMGGDDMGGDDMGGDDMGGDDMGGDDMGGDDMGGDDMGGDDMGGDDMGGDT